MFKHAILMTGITLLSSFGAVAGTITTPTVDVTVTDTSGNALLQQFDRSLGPLTGITLNFGTTIISDDISISDFEAGGTIDITYDLGHRVTFSLPAGSPYVPKAFEPLSCSGAGAVLSSCNNSGQVFSVFTATSFDISSAPQAPFIGLGTIAFPYAPSLVESVVNSTPANPADLTLAVTNLSLVTTESITYTYGTAAPEPGSIGMIAIGLAGLLWLSRRRGFKARAATRRSL